MTNTFDIGDRVMVTDRYHHDALGKVVEVVAAGGVNDTLTLLVQLDTPTDWCFEQTKTARWFAPVTTKLVPAAARSGNRAGTRLDQVLKHLLTGKTLTQGEGLVLGYGTRVAASVHELRRKGHTIVTTMKEDLNGFPYAEYRLVTRRANGNRKVA